MECKMQSSMTWAAAKHITWHAMQSGTKYGRTQARLMGWQSAVALTLQ